MEHNNNYKDLRHSLVYDELAKQGIKDKNVLHALAKVPRHEFVNEEFRHLAYENIALPLSHRQTISQPLIVGVMTQAAEVDIKSKVLEIGTGSGYQAAILGSLCKEIYSVEVIEALAEQATKVIKKLGYNNIHIRAANGYDGWIEKAPFDAIVVTAAANEVPAPLLKQLKIGGKLVIPLEQQNKNQELVVITKTESGFEEKYLLPVRFVPFVHN